MRLMKRSCEVAFGIGALAAVWALGFLTMSGLAQKAFVVAGLS